MGTLYIATQLVRWQMARRHVGNSVRQLRAALDDAGKHFSPQMVADLPEPVQRLFRFAIAPGSRLYVAAELEMTGSFRFDRDKKAVPMTAHQVICAPHGMVWRASIGSGPGAISGSDGVLSESSWTQFALYDLFPVAQIRGDDNHYRSAVARMLAEAMFWTPAAFLISLPVSWESASSNEILATVQHGPLKTTFAMRLDEDGCPLEVSFQRWSDANPEKKYQMQPFGGVLSNFEEFEGIKIPTHVEAGNFFGTDDYFPFYEIDVKGFKWLHQDPPAMQQKEIPTDNQAG